MTKETFTELVLASEKTLYRVSMSMLKNETDCEDAVQTAILSAYQKLDTLKNEDFFKTWLVRILINVCNKQLNHNKRFIDIREYMETAVPASDINVDVKIALEQLPVKIREAVVLYYIEEFSVKEIKSILHIPEGTVFQKAGNFLNSPCNKKAVTRKTTFFRVTALFFKHGCLYDKVYNFSVKCKLIDILK